MPRPMLATFERVSLALLLLGTGPCVARGQESGLVVDSALQAHLDAIADTATTEHVLCLTGYPTVGGVVRLTDAVEMDGLAVAAGSEDVRRGRIMERLCATAAPQAMAVYHNHVFTPADSSPEKACYFSLTDQNTFLKYETAPLAIVQVRTGVTCWWARGQVARAWVAHLVPLHPIIGQP